MSESILGFIEQHSQWAMLIVFIIAFLESVAIIGILMPGWVLLVGVGTLIGADVLSFYPMAIAAYIGAVLGEYLSYLVGYHYHHQILSWRFVAKHDALIQNSRNFFHRYGVSGVFIGRFLGPSRAVIPLVAGISEMNKHTFFWVNVISGILWVPVYLIPGILIGAAFSLEKDVSYQLVLVIALIMLFGAYAVNTTRRLIKAQSKSKVESHANALKWHWIKFCLVWLILLCVMTIFVLSPLFDLLLQILQIVWRKL
ncbi:DedA family protein [Aliikangiella maris]|uniref:DedA family protein n=2 Tax=Aliikangiella maris TaxID=3162458 RepID=A0ABV2BRD2_9GAMM